MSLEHDGYKILHDVQKKCNELNRKIDSIIRIMEMMTTWMRYSSLMAEFQTASGSGSQSPGDCEPDKETCSFSQSFPEGSETMNQSDFQRILNTARQSDHAMTQDEFNQLFEALKQGKTAEETARMEQMVQLAKSFMKS